MIATNKDRILCGAYWRNQHNDLRELIARYPDAGVKAQRDLNLMGHFYLDVADILANIADTLHPRSIEHLDKLREYWFKELEPS
jgi:hypothetical protein